MSRARKYFAWQSRLACNELGRRVVEVGCGVGNFTSQLLNRELVIGLDVESPCVEQLLVRYSDQKNLLAFTMDVTEPRFRDLIEFRPDSVVCLNVLEHIEDDIVALFNMGAVLPAGGCIVLIVPAFQSLYGPIDHNLGHWRRYERSSLRRVAEKAGLAVRTLHYMNFVGFFGWWMNARILHRTKQSEAQIALFDSVIVPVISRLEGWVPPPFGQNLFAILEKRA